MHKKKDFHRSLCLFTAMEVYMKSRLFKAQKQTFHRLLWPLAVMDVYMKSLTKYVQKERGSSFVVSVYGHGG